MKYLQNLHEPERLLLTWQRPNDLPPRTRRVVAEIVRNQEGYTLTYLKENQDYRQAVEHGFVGYPAFDPKQAIHSTGVMEALSRRLPPRKREDFSEYLAQFRLPQDFSGSDMALLGYTGGKLPSDTFGFVPDFGSAPYPIDLLLEVAGFRHQDSMGKFEPQVDMPVHFRLDTDNPVDSNAVQVWHAEHRLGYVNRALLPWFANYLRSGRELRAHIERVNGKPERPLIYVFCQLS